MIVVDVPAGGDANDRSDDRIEDGGTRVPTIAFKRVYPLRVVS